MRLRVLTLLAILATPCAAAPEVSLSWNACAPIQSSLETTTPGKYTLYLSLTGFDQPHSTYIATLKTRPWAPYLPDYPDAWRFDAAGCQTQAFLRILDQPPAAVAADCLPFRPPASGDSVEFYPLSNFQDQSLSLGAILRYGPEPAADPTKRYFLLAFEFDHMYSLVGSSPSPDYCGGMETPMCFAYVLVSVRVPPDQFIELATSTSNISASFNQPLGCGVNVGVHPTTWGAIKSQYR